MIVVMSPGTSEQDMGVLRERIESRGLKLQINVGMERTVFGVMGANPPDFKDEIVLLN